MAIVVLGFLVGWLTSPKVGVVFIWVTVISAEILGRSESAEETEREFEDV